MDWSEDFGVSGRVGVRSVINWVLIDIDYFIKVF